MRGGGAKAEIAKSFESFTLCPIWLRQSAAASPAGPDPTTATFIPVRCDGMRGTTHPSSQALSMMEYSMLLIVTGESTKPATHAPSQGAGQTRPVNSGKLFVCSLEIHKRCVRVSYITHGVEMRPNDGQIGKRVVAGSFWAVFQYSRIFCTQEGDNPKLAPDVNIAFTLRLREHGYPHCSFAPYVPDRRKDDTIACTIVELCACVFVFYVLQRAELGKNGSGGRRSYGTTQRGEEMFEHGKELKPICASLHVQKEARDTLLRKWSATRRSPKQLSKFSNYTMKKLIDRFKTTHTHLRRLDIRVQRER